MTFGIYVFYRFVVSFVVVFLHSLLLALAPGSLLAKQLDKHMLKLMVIKDDELKDDVDRLFPELRRLPEEFKECDADSSAEQGDDEPEVDE